MERLRLSCLLCYSDGTSGDAPWWRDRVDFECSELKPGRVSGSDGDSTDHDPSSTPSKALSDIGSLLEDYSEKKKAQFSEYSMSSSVVPRSEGL